jgi:hypothetical protein
MQQDWTATLSSVAEVNQKVVDTATALNKIAARTQGQIARRQFAAFEDCLDAGSRHLHVVTQVADPTQAMKRHAEVAVELGEKLVAATQATIELQVQARDEVVSLIEKGMQSAKAQVMSASKPPAPARRTPRTTKKSG